MTSLGMLSEYIIFHFSNNYFYLDTEQYTA